MNHTRSKVSRVSLLMLICVFLFQGMTFAAMLCCGPDHSTPAMPSAAVLSMTSDTSTDHCHHSTELQAEMKSMQELHEHEIPGGNHPSSCSGCAASCTTTALMIIPFELVLELVHSERIFSLTPQVVSLISSGLERPPRL